MRELKLIKLTHLFSGWIRLPLVDPRRRGRARAVRDRTPFRIPRPRARSRAPPLISRPPPRTRVRRRSRVLRRCLLKTQNEKKHVVVSLIARANVKNKLTEAPCEPSGRGRRGVVEVDPRARQALFLLILAALRCVASGGRRFRELHESVLLLVLRRRDVSASSTLCSTRGARDE